MALAAGASNTAGMDEDPESQRGPDDVLSMGAGRTPRWGVVGAVLAVLLLAVGGFQLVSGPPDDATPEAAEAAEARTSRQTAARVHTGPPAWALAPTPRPLTVRLGRRVVDLRGAVISQPHREPAATVLGRTGQGWLVRLTSTACEDRSDTRVGYGTASGSGHLTAWHSSRRGGTAVWRSPDRTLSLVAHGARLELRRTPGDRLVRTFEHAD